MQIYLFLNTSHSQYILTPNPLRFRVFVLSVLTNYSPSFFKEKTKKTLSPPLENRRLVPCTGVWKQCCQCCFMDWRDGFGRLWDIFFHCLSLKYSESISATFFTLNNILFLLFVAIYLFVLCSYQRLVCCCFRLSLLSTTARYRPRASET